MTELDAVNEMLASIGEAPVNSIGTGLSESRLAQLQLERTSREVQRKGWFFNREYNYKLIPNNKGEIQLPRNTLKLDSGTQRFQARGRRLYDTLRNTYQFKDHVHVDLIKGLSWGDLPTSAQIFIVAKASRVFQNDFLGSESLSQFHLRDEQVALAELEAEELEAGNYSIFNNPEIARDMQRHSSRNHSYSDGFLGSTYSNLTGDLD